MAGSHGLERLTAQDLLMLWADDFGWSEDIGVLTILDGAPLLDSEGRVRVDEVRRRLEPRLHLVPRLRQLLHRPRWGLGWPPVPSCTGAGWTRRGRCGRRGCCPGCRAGRSACSCAPVGGGAAGRQPAPAPARAGPGAVGPGPWGRAAARLAGVWREFLAERAPRTSLNRPIGADRRLAVVRGRLEVARQVAHAHQAKVNDVVLARTSGSWRCG